jgi:hypothetical protein
VLRLILRQLLRGFFILARLKISVYLVAILLTGSIAAKSIGSLQPINPALKGFVEGCEDKPQPCWYGIVPGNTMTKEAEIILTDLEYIADVAETRTIYVRNEDFTPSLVYIDQSRRYPSGIVAGIIIELKERVQFADIMLMFGSPSHLVMGYGSMAVSFQDELVYAHSLKYPATSRPNPFMTVTSVTLSAFSLTPMLETWHGFIPLWRYCQIEPSFPSCAL